MTRPRLATVASATVASAIAFYIITRSGLAGTLAGAAVASMISTGTAHWVGGGLDRCSTWWLERRRPTGGDQPSEADEETTRVLEPQQTELFPATTPEAALPGAVGTRPSERPAWLRALPTWGPVILAVLAIAVSGYAVVTGHPLERVVIKERVVGPTTQRVVVQRETVTVTVPVPSGTASGRAAGPAPTVPSASSPGTSVGPPATTTTTAGTTTTTTSPTTTTSGPTTVTSQPTSVNGG